MANHRPRTPEHPKVRLSPEQREHAKENRTREDAPIEHRKTDGPNTPAT